MSHRGTVEVLSRKLSTMYLFISFHRHIGKTIAIWNIIDIESPNLSPGNSLEQLSQTLLPTNKCTIRSKNVLGHGFKNSWFYNISFPGLPKQDKKRWFLISRSAEARLEKMVSLAKTTISAGPEVLKDFKDYKIEEMRFTCLKLLGYPLKWYIFVLISTYYHTSQDQTMTSSLKLLPQVAVVSSFKERLLWMTIYPDRCASNDIAQVTSTLYTCQEMYYIKSLHKTLLI